jgi:predicted enzyme related to lactoylglutathione lyase
MPVKAKAKKSNNGRLAGVNIKRVERVIIFVKDFDRAIEFYTKTLGLSLKSKEQGWAEFSTSGTTLCLHHGRETHPTTHEPQIGFRVDDLDETLDALRARGVVVAPVTNPCPRVRATHFTDPEGNTIGLEGR